MTQPSLPGRTDLRAALGRLPSGLYILTARLGDRDTGLLASWVQQAGFDPPMLTVALRLGKPVTDGVAACGRFTLSQVAHGQKHLIRHFARGFGPDEAAFTDIDTVRTPGGGLALSEALAFLEAEVVGTVESGDHRVFLGRIRDGAVLHPEAEPLVHVRRDGSHY
jgi:flavin reductase (DIM6/NTAB) family NADH-FMN oxidoreductase RutF